MRGMSVGTAALMLFLGRHSAGLFYRQPRAGYDRRSRQASAENSRWPYAFMRSRYRKRFQLEYCSQHGAPWWPRAGLSQNDDLLAALFPRHGERAQPPLRRCGGASSGRAAHRVVQLLPNSPLREKMTKTAYGQLKQYLDVDPPGKNGRRVVRHHANAGLAVALSIADAVWQGSGPAAGILCRQSGVASAVASACR